MPKQILNESTRQNWIGSFFLWAKATFYLDARSLALARILLGCVILWDVCGRWGDIHALLSDNGVVSRALVIDYQKDNTFMTWGLWMQGPFAANESGGKFLLFAQGITAIAFILGWKTRVFTILLWFFVIQLHIRNPFVLQGGDTMMRALLFWMMFLPCGRNWSLDQKFQSAKPDTASKKVKNPPLAANPIQNTIVGVGSFCFIAQLLMVYIFTFILKWHPIWYHLDAIYYALNYDQLTTKMGMWLREFPLVTKSLTFVTFYIIEGLCPILLLVFGAKKILRILIPLLLIGFHLSLVIFMEIDHFPFVCIAAWLAILPGSLWDRFEKNSTSQQPSLIAPLPVPQHQRYLQIAIQSVAIFYIFMVLIWNIRTLNFSLHKAWFPKEWNGIVEIVHLGQHWNMFAPFPARDDGWFIILGKTNTGEQVDLFRGRSSDFNAKPAFPAQDFKNNRWSKLYSLLHGKKNMKLREALLAYLYKQWNENNPSKPITSIQFTYRQEWTPDPPK